MKTSIINAIILVMLLGILACKQTEKQTSFENLPEQPLMVSKHQSVFDSSFSIFLQTYYDLSAQFYLQQADAVNNEALLMLTRADSLPFQLLKADTVIIETAQQNVANIKAELVGMAGEQSMQEKLKGFAAISQSLYDLIRTVQYSKTTVYHFHCSSVFNNVGADWLSESRIVKNPYLPALNMKCGNLLDSLHFSH
ncbi:MAG: DUF3347 domain-containing protein [Bacteroidota bacterium]|jgi:hypothetical protein|nr:DUF3347 domain-containing protein [Bacteroidota bacterium]